MSIHLRISFRRILIYIRNCLWIFDSHCTPNNRWTCSCLRFYRRASSYIQLSMLNYTEGPSNRFYMSCNFHLTVRNLSNTTLGNLLHKVQCSLLSNNRFCICCICPLLSRTLLLNNKTRIRSWASIFFHRSLPNNRSYSLCILPLLHCSLIQGILRCICFHILDPSILCCI